jgi:small subunit ribosomal protein S1
MEDMEKEQTAEYNDELEAGEEEDFAKLFEESQAKRDKKVQRDTKIEGVVVSIGEEWIFVDVGGKTEGAIARSELIDENGQPTVKVGDTLTAYVVSTKGDDILLSINMTSAASEEALQGAYRSGVPVEGLVREERKGGFGVSILGKTAFCPYSQIDLHPPGVAEEYLGKRFSFRIMEYSDRGRNIVISRRNILEEEKAEKVGELKRSLSVGDTVTGKVTNLADFGAFVDIGGIDGLIPMSELAWHRVHSASDLLQSGDEVTVKVLDLDWERNRISLSRKQTLEDPWTTVSERYSEDTVLEGTVRKLMDFGAFVELEPGIEGLVHISHLGAGRRINHPKEVVSEGDHVEVKVLSVDQEAHRIGLELTHALDETGEPPPELNPGDLVSGTVDSVKDYGLFVLLPGGKTGLLHVSEMAEGGGVDVRRRFKPDDVIDVEILSIDPDTGKISLSSKSLSRKEEDAQAKEYGRKGKEGSIGTLGDLLKDKIKI